MARNPSVPLSLASVVAFHDLGWCFDRTNPLLIATNRARSPRTNGVPVSNGSFSRAPLSAVPLGAFLCELSKLATETQEVLLEHLCYALAFRYPLPFSVHRHLSASRSRGQKVVGYALESTT